MSNYHSADVKRLAQSLNIVKDIASTISEITGDRAPTTWEESRVIISRANSIVDRAVRDTAIVEMNKMFTPIRSKLATVYIDWRRPHFPDEKNFNLLADKIIAAGVEKIIFTQYEEKSILHLVPAVRAAITGVDAVKIRRYIGECYHRTGGHDITLLSYEIVDSFIDQVGFPRINIRDWDNEL